MTRENHMSSMETVKLLKQLLMDETLRARFEHERDALLSGLPLPAEEKTALRTLNLDSLIGAVSLKTSSAGIASPAPFRRVSTGIANPTRTIFRPSADAACLK